jgi:hypothetical protein
MVPGVSAGSSLFVPDICSPSLLAMLLNYGRTIYRRYGFADAFNPMPGWVSRYFIGTDAGITLLIAEGLRTGNEWHRFMSNTEIEPGVNMIGLAPRSPRDGKQTARKVAEVQK